MKTFSSTKHDRFRERLNAEYQWPTPYMFKFIVPKDALPQVEALFPKQTITFRDSRQGNYVSATITLDADCADFIIAIYEQAARIEGLIAL